MKVALILFCIVSFSCGMEGPKTTTVNKAYQRFRDFLMVKGNIRTSNEILSACPNFSPERITPSRTGAVAVSGNFDAYNFTGVDDVKEVAILVGRLAFIWSAECDNSSAFLNETEYSRVRVRDPSIFWLPNILLISNSLLLSSPKSQAEFSQYLEIGYQPRLGIFKFSWALFGIFEFSCPLNLRNFPADIQQCTALFQTVDTKGLVNFEHFVFSNYFYPNALGSENSAWKLLWAFPFVSTGFAISSISGFTFTVARRPEFYMTHLGGPCLVLAILEMCSFGLPPNGGERTAYTMTIYLAFAVLEAQLMDAIPKSPQTLLFVDFIIFQIGFSLLSTIYCALLCFFCERFENLAYKKVPLLFCSTRKVPIWSLVDLIAFLTFLLALITATVYYMTSILDRAEPERPML